MREHPKSIGDTSTLAVMLALQACGYDLLLPFGENTRYDLVIDDGARLARVQCKTGRLRAGAIRFRTSSSYAHHPNPRARIRAYGEEVDFFAVYCRDNGCVYLVPIEDLPTQYEASLRLEPAKNSQRQGIRSAKQYEIGQTAVLTGGLAARPGA
jgi:PD-(D/E)XK nuclease superfamily protein